MNRGVPRSLSRAVGLSAMLAFSTDADAQQAQLSEARFVGAAGCKSSSCHGGAGEKRSQYLTWTRHDFHARAYAVLTNARSARIAEGLGLPAASTSSRCTTCHSPFQAVAPARLAPATDPREGVSCESCHGAAEPWLRGHTRTDWTYATRVGAGMRDLKSFYVRANTCVACHQNLDSDIIAAGHPEMVFELDRQSISQPKHWRDPPGSGVRAWLVGQAVALRELSWRLGLNEKAEPQTHAQWNALAWLLAEVTAAERLLLPIEAPAAANNADALRRVQQQADALARRAAQQNFGSDFNDRLLRHLATLDTSFIETADTPRAVLFQRAQRLVLALERLSIARQGASDAATPSPELAMLREDLQAPSDFPTADFSAHLLKFRLSLGTP